MSLKCEPFSEPLHIFAEWLFGGGHRALAREFGKLLLDLGPVVHLVQLVRVERHPQPARPVHRIISMIQWIRTSRLSIKHSLSLAAASCSGPVSPFQTYNLNPLLRPYGVSVWYRVWGRLY